MKSNSTTIPKPPRRYRPEELRVGLTCELARELTEDDILGYAENSGDWNPLHVDQEYATETNYGGRIAHGAFQIGLASALAGMHLPGRDVLLTSISSQFPAPLRFPSHVKVTGEITAWNADQRCGSLRVKVMVSQTGITTADIVATFSYHQQRNSLSQADVPSVSRTPASPRLARTVIVTGASGALGSALTRALASQYRVLALGNLRQASSTEEEPNTESASIDLGSAGWYETLEALISPGQLYAVVHCAWPGYLRGGLLSASKQALRAQLDFGSTHLVDLARLLVHHKAEGPGRLIAIGSTAGAKAPSVQHAAYSLGKATLEQTVQLLAAELGSKQITANAICPSFLPVGMNSHVNDRQIQILRAKVPLGRLCEPRDVTQAVSWLLSDQANFVSGQILHLTGAQLSAAG